MDFELEDHEREEVVRALRYHAENKAPVPTILILERLASLIEDCADAGCTIHLS